MTEIDIIKKLARIIDDRKFPFQLANAFIYSWECDYWAMTSDGETREFEIKCSRQDFMKDKEKEKHTVTDVKGANYFYYVCPAGLILPTEVDKRYGLIYVTDGLIANIVKKPRRLNNNQFDQWKMLATKLYWKFRALWRQKWIEKEITFDEYAEGFMIELIKEEAA
jgi:hypothetical protein